MRYVVWLALAPQALAEGKDCSVPKLVQGMRAEGINVQELSLEWERKPGRYEFIMAGSRRATEAGVRWLNREGLITGAERVKALYDIRNG